MAQYRTCPWCGDHLDHGERCECTASAAAERETATPPERAQGYMIGVDLAQGKDFTAAAKPYISRA